MVLQINNIADKLDALRFKTVVMTNGCFDLFHIGHLYTLQEAKKFGDILVIAINSDESIRALKGAGRPILNLETRMAILSSLEMVDYVIPFSGERATDVIAQIEPDVYVKGSDYTLDTLDDGEREALENVGAQIKFINTIATESTSDILDRIKKSDNNTEVKSKFINDGNQLSVGWRYGDEEIKVGIDASSGNVLWIMGV